MIDFFDRERNRPKEKAEVPEFVVPNPEQPLNPAPAPTENTEVVSEEKTISTPASRIGNVETTLTPEPAVELKQDPKSRLNELLRDISGIEGDPADWAEIVAKSSEPEV